MTYERDPRPRRDFNADLPADRPAPLAPGRSTRIEDIEDAPIDVSTHGRPSARSPEPAAPHLRQAVAGGDRPLPRLDLSPRSRSRHDVTAGQAPASGPATAAAGTASAFTDPWGHVFGEASTPVNKLGRVQAPRGRTLLLHPYPSSVPSMAAPLPFNTPVMVLRRTMQPTAAKRWCYVTAPDHGATGFCEERYLAIDPPEPRAQLHRVVGGETLGRIARDVYGEHIKSGNDERLYVQALYEANKDRAGVTLSSMTLPWSATWHRRAAEEKTLEVYLGVQVLQGMSLWLPSNEFIQRLKASGAITSGSSELSKAWHTAAEVVDGAVEAVKYAAGFVLGLLEGAWSAIADLFQGAADMLEAVARTVYYLVTGNPDRIKAMLMRWADKMKSAWEQRGAIADEFLRKWNAPSGWDRGRFHGEVLGWIMMTVLIIILTLGESAAASAGGLAARFPQVVKLLKTVDAVGDITTYLGGAIKSIRSTRQLPDAAPQLVKDKLGKAAPSTGAKARPTTNVEGAGRPPAVVTVRGYAQGPRLQWAKNPDGAVRTVDEAMEIARKHGVEIPDDILVRKISGKFMRKDTYAQYLYRTGQDPHKTITWEEFYDRDLDHLLVRIEESVFHSDEAIVAIIGHEMHELNHLRRLFKASGGTMTYRRLHYLINPGIKGNLHDQAWEVADQLVETMRKRKE
jgi:hypothetical protein